MSPCETPALSALPIHSSLKERVNGQRRQVGWENKFTNHTDYVSGITYNHFLTLIMCRYSASSICELAISSSSGEIRLNDSRGSAELTFLEETNRKKESEWLARQPTKGPIGSRGNCVRAVIWCSYHNTQTNGTQLPETERAPLKVSLLPAAN